MHQQLQNSNPADVNFDILGSGEGEGGDYGMNIRQICKSNTVNILVDLKKK